MDITGWDNSFLPNFVFNFSTLGYQHGFKVMSMCRIMSNKCTIKFKNVYLMYNDIDKKVKYIKLIHGM